MASRDYAPHYVLICEASTTDDEGQWKFVLRHTDGVETLTAGDQEPEFSGERLQLLTVIRGLEALDQPSKVTVFTPSRSVARGINRNLEEWRRNGWTWESYGRMVPIKNLDLWQRLDRALQFHRVTCRFRRLSQPRQQGTRWLRVEQAHSPLRPASSRDSRRPASRERVSGRQFMRQDSQRRMRVDAGNRPAPRLLGRLVRGLLGRLPNVWPKFSTSGGVSCSA